MGKINIAEIIKCYPKGMELDCTICEDVYFDYVSEFNIIHCYIQYETYRTSITFNQYGAINSDIKSKCVIFPKGKTTWEGFVPPCHFKDGDILFVDCSDGEDKGYQYIFILNKPEFYGKWHSYCHLDGVGDFHSIATYLAYDEDHPRFATEEEKEKLFKVIKDNGYRWNEETKNLEKLVEPQFNVGDRIRYKDDKTVITITGIKDNYYLIQFYNLNKNDYQNEKISFKDQDKYELVSEFKDGDVIFCENHWGSFISIFKENVTERNGFIGHCVFDVDDNEFKVKDSASYFNKVRFATKSEKELLFRVIKKNGYKWNPDNKILDKSTPNPDKFDITSLKTFDQVLVRDFDNTPWEIEFFSRLLDGKHFKCSGLSYMQCIPYKGNEHLNGKKDDCDKYFKTWE